MSAKPSAALQVAVLGMLALPSGALAQSVAANPRPAEAGPLMGEVVVTARRREESLQDVPGSVTALSGASIEQREIKALEDVGAPGLSFTPIGGNAGGFYIRGIGQNDAAITFEPGVGVYIDGVYRGRLQGGSLGLLDLERVEVLRGPQGTLYGRNSVGGAVNLISRSPTHAVSGQLRAGFGNFDSYSVSGALNVPISEFVTTRTSAAYSRRDGYTEDFLTGKEYDDDAFMGARNVIAFTPNDDIELTLATDYLERPLEGAGMQCEIVNPAAPLLPLLEGYQRRTGQRSYAQLCAETTSRGKDFNSIGARTARLTEDSSEEWGTALTARWRLHDAIELKSISAYRELDSTQFSNVTGVPAQLIEITRGPISQSQFSQEFQGQGQMADGRLNFTLGLFYYDEDVDRIDSSFLPPFGAAALTQQQNQRESYAVYGQSTYKLTDSVAVTAGVRYTREDVNYEAFDQSLINGALSNVVDPISEEFSDVTHLVNVSYDFTPDAMVYASWATGFKSGGFNTDAVPGFKPAFGPEEVDTYEVGFKATWLEGALLTNLAVYRSDYVDQQVQRQVFNPQTNAVAPLFQNAAESRIEGFELEVVARPLSSWRISAGYSYIEARFLSFDSLDEDTLEPISLADSEMPQTPRHQVTISNELSIPSGLVALEEFRFNVDYSYTSEVFLDVENPESLRRDDLSMVNASLSTTLASYPLELRLWGRNLTDERFVRWGIDFDETFGMATVARNEPRTYGMSVSWQF
jgi:iron complex outermembrane recepter protein